MDDFEEITTEDDGKEQLLPNIKLSTETFDQEELPPKKRIKRDEQNVFWIDTTGEAPENLNLESGKSLTTSKPDSCTFSNDTYSCEIKTEPISPNYSKSLVWDPQGYEGSPITSAFVPQNLPKIKQASCTTSSNAYSCVLKTDSPGTNCTQTESAFRNPEECATTSTNVTNAVLSPKVSRSYVMCPPQNGSVPCLEQPPGCKTVVISGLSHFTNSSLDTAIADIREMFTICGKIQKIILIEKGVFQITFACQTGVDNMVKLNGYKVVGTHKDVRFDSKIEVEFAPIWLAKQNFICQTNDKPRPLSSCIDPSSEISYSKNAVAPMIQVLDQDCMVKQCVNVLVSWLEQGKCTRKNYLNFFLVLQAMYDLVSRSISDQNKFKELVCQNYCSQILKAFNVACSESVLDNLKQHKMNQVVKWKKYIVEINECKSWDAISAFKKTDLYLENSARQKNITSKSLSKILCSKNPDEVIEKFIQALKQDCIDKKALKLIVLCMQSGKYPKNNYSKYFLALESMHGFISRFIKDPTKFEELVSRYYCSQILRAFNVACSETVINNFEGSDIKNKIKMWKKYIEEVRKCRSWEAISAFANREVEQILGNENLLTEKEQPNKIVKADNSKNYNQNNETGNQNNENDIQNIDNEILNSTSENELKNNETVCHNNETDNYANENNVQNKEGNNQNNRNDDYQNDIGVKIVGKEARLIAALGAFLNLHSFGASIEDICKYLLQIDPTTTCQGVEGLMRKFPTVFKEELTSNEISKTKWTILDYKK